MSATYQILDEPQGGTRAGLVIEPFWALLAVMLAGAWLGAALFAINAWFVRGPYWRRELALSAALLIGAALVYLLAGSAAASELIPAAGIKYALLAVIVWKISLAYWIYFQQETAFELYKYFGGKVQNGLPIVLIGVFAGRWVARLVDHPMWRAVVA